MANERVWNYRNTGTKEEPVWEKWFQKTVADAVYMDESGSKTILQYFQEKLNELIGGAPETYDTLKEIADYIAEHQEVADALNLAITRKAEKEHTHTKDQITDFPTIPTKTSQLLNDSGFKDIDTTYGEATTETAGLLSAEDKQKLDGIAEHANSYQHPSTHAANMITQDATHRFVSDAEKSNWNAKADILFSNILPTSAEVGAICFLM